jgi:hypothetical protein
VPIPHDREKRWWVEAAGTNPDLVDSFRPALVGLVAFDRNRLPRIIGTGFVVAAQPEFALVCSAKHVFTEGVLSAQRPVRGHAASAIVVHTVDKTPSLDPNKLKVFWQGSNNAAMLNIAYANYNDTFDIASCILTPQEGESITERVSIPLDTDVPSTGDVVHMVALEGMEVQELAPPSDWSGKGQQLSIFRSISIRVGVVTGVYPKGFRQYRWPAFTTSIPAKPGMSGGFVYWPREGVTIAACGIVCADSSTEESHQDFFHCGHSVIGCAWPALSLRLPFSVPCPPDSPSYTLFEMVRRGLVPPPLGGIEGIRLIETGSGDCIIGKVVT